MYHIWASLEPISTNKVQVLVLGQDFWSYFWTGLDFSTRKGVSRAKCCSSETKNLQADSQDDNL